MTRHIAIIGAGMAGLAAAGRVRAAGHDATLFDKSRGLGGRMATRRVGALQFDHGAQYFTAKGEGFRSQLESWLASGQAAQWQPGHFVGTPGMTAPARAMAEGLSVVTGSQVASVSRGLSGWSVMTADGLVETPGNGSFDAVVLAVPAPQAQPLAASCGVSFPELADVRYAPCWALMLAFPAETALGFEALRPQSETIAWIARNSGKPGRPSDAQTVVVHASPAWSRANLERRADEVAAALTESFRQLTGVQEAASYSAAHRWRYAMVEQAAGQPFLWDAQAGLGACGDWCIGPRVEAAFDSGDALGAAISAQMALAHAS